MKYLYLSVLVFFLACREELPGDASFPLLMEVPESVTLPEPPADNHFTPERWQLGKRLFYDKVMSSDSSLSCASCHRSELAFADDLPLSKGVRDRNTTVNVPSLTNVAFNPYYTMAGGVETLEKQVLIPIQEHNEFDFNMVLIVERLRNDSSYIKMCKDAYDRIPDAFSVTRAIACFERSLLSFGSDFDLYDHGKNKEKMSPSAIRGMDIFMGEKARCNSCHSGTNFTNYAFENNGLHINYVEEGRKRVTGLDIDESKFKVPGLRNLIFTAPYMHDGSMPDLMSVIMHYESGGQPHKNKSPILRPFQLTSQERSDLTAFLKSLSDRKFVENPIFKK